MNANLLLAVVVLLAVLVGAALVVMVQLSVTLRSVRSSLDSTTRNLNRVLADSGEVARRMKKISADLEKGVEGASSLLRATGDLAAAIRQARDTVRIATAVGGAAGPAVAAFVQTLRAGCRADGEAAEGEAGEEPARAETEETKRSEPIGTKEGIKPTMEGVPHE